MSLTVATLNLSLSGYPRLLVPTLDIPTLAEPPIETDWKRPAISAIFSISFYHDLKKSPPPQSIDSQYHSPHIELVLEPAPDSKKLEGHYLLPPPPFAFLPPPTSKVSQVPQTL
ncbi:hypothetical protein ACFX15_021933 [Malus domestica]